ncbi:GNAT family N-acetyltransferase [Actinokineospora enzanensis]|uniref:GNAT family N-acetyltransferase n=1 Tax=Actinokineospora enzanensis TaxID=155975 RepID=UPI0003726D3E|nr:GNAT family N-acetyltransferase [Actinokineospora enzanensis]
MTDENLLDNPAWHSLTGPHARFAERRGGAVRYADDVSVFSALDPGAGPTGWSDLAALIGPGTEAVLPGTTAGPAGWEVDVIEGVQLVDDGVVGAPDPEAVRLTAADVPEMLDLVARTKPGPLLPRTIELGTYLGVKQDGVLIAMAGERMHPPGWTEISAVCTDPAHRGKGLATRLVLAVAAGIQARGETPFLHTGAANTNAIRLYEQLGFRLRRRMRFVLVRVPAAQPV